MSKIKFFQLIITTITLLPISLLIKIPKGYTQDYYGAIAVGGFGAANAYSNNYQTLYEAQESAIRECRKSEYPSAKLCKIAVSFKNSCGALAISIASYGASANINKAIAEENALRICRKDNLYTSCRIIYSVCTTRKR